MDVCNKILESIEACNTKRSNGLKRKLFEKDNLFDGTYYSDLDHFYNFMDQDGRCAKLIKYGLGSSWTRIIVVNLYCKHYPFLCLNQLI